MRYPHGTITRAQILARAQRWIVEQVPYSQVSWKVDMDGTYRQDCSGYVSMAWALDQTVDFWTGNLNTVSHVIAGAALEPGDILLSDEHTVLFAGWADASHDTFDFYEEAHPGTNARFVVDAPLSAYLDNGFAAFRYDGVTGGSQVPANPATGLDWTSLEAGGSELVPAGVSTDEPLPASFQATTLPPAVVAASASASASAQFQPVAATLSAAQLPLPFVVAASGAMFLVGGAVVARRGPGLVPSRPRRRH